ncbi:DUF4129 domain-containing protein [Natronosporangium hydrolyticum]|uniref:DUF4129 domain-containing protein n=1 Tax=Natronosporangium hydrolyticum TaxID=2811111 RepID=A0A895YQD1_9ACTN|nr:DUF4129 domain-containing protein [Natronosporangium hydrolyticum]
MLALTGVVLVGVAVAAGFGTVEISARDTGWQAPAAPPTPFVPEPPPLAEPVEAEESTIPWLATAFRGLLIALFAAVAALLARALWRYLRRITFKPRWLRVRGLRGAATSALHDAALAEAAADEHELFEAVSEAVLRSEDDQDPRRAVIGCWVRLTEAAEQAGVPRHRSDTATDLVVRLLRGQQVSESVLGEFAEVYRRARFASHPVDERMRQEARDALARLQGELAARVGVSG